MVAATDKAAAVVVPAEDGSNACKSSVCNPSLRGGSLIRYEDKKSKLWLFQRTGNCVAGPRTLSYHWDGSVGSASWSLDAV